MNEKIITIISKERGGSYVSVQMAVEEYEGLPWYLHSCIVYDADMPVHVYPHTVFYATDNGHVHHQ